MASPTTIKIAATANVIRIPVATASGRAVVTSIVADANDSSRPRPPDNGRARRAYTSPLRGRVLSCIRPPKPAGHEPNTIRTIGHVFVGIARGAGRIG